MSKKVIIKKEPNIDETYAMRPTQIFDSIFTKPSIWQDYESVIKSRN